VHVSALVLLSTPSFSEPLLGGMKTGGEKERVKGRRMSKMR
jgi:hypothetical protein